MLKKYVDAIPTTRRLELLTHQAITAIHLGNLELATSKLEEAISISKTVDTKLWHSTIEENIQQLQTKWGNEPIVKNTIQMLKER
jgi:LPS sulfotransferase NodH